MLRFALRSRPTRRFRKLRFYSSHSIVPEGAIHYTFARSGGNGGQNVNKVNTKVTGRFNVFQAKWMGEEVRMRFVEMNRNRITKDGDFVFYSEKERTQGGNMRDCNKKIENWVKEAMVVPEERIETDMPMWTNESRMKLKKKRSETKGQRRVSF